jgi:hypothetical protein
MLPRLAALCVACLALPQIASADRFYFGSAETEEKMVAGTPDYVEGVLLRKEEGNLVIRVQGGEISVPESSVYKIEADALTVDAIAQREKDAAPRLAEANERRREVQAAEAQQMKDAYIARREAEEAEALAAAEAAQAALADQLATLNALGAGGLYDPILHLYQTGAGCCYPPWTPVTPERVDRGRSLYLAAHEYFDLTKH